MGDRVGSEPQVRAPIAPEQAASPASYAAVELARLLNTALGMLELMAARMPPSALRQAIDAECAAMRSAASAAIKRATET